MLVDHHLLIFCNIFRFDFSTFGAIKLAVILTSSHIIKNLCSFFIVAVHVYQIPFFFS